MKVFKSSIFAFSIMVVIVCVSACNQKTSAPVDENVADTTTKAEAEAPAPVTYVNDKYGYSITLPVGFSQQNNDAEMEAERGGKLFLGNGCMIDVTARKMNYSNITPEESVKQCYEVAVALHEGDPENKILSKESASDHHLIKSLDSFGLRGDFEMQKGGNKIMVNFTYPEEKRAEFDRDVEAVLNSLKVTGK